MIGHFLGARRAEILAAAALFTAGAVLIGLGSFEPYVPQVPLPVRFVPLALVCIGVVVRRTDPVWCLGLGSVGFVMELMLGLSLGTVFVFTDNLYAFARYGPRRGMRILLPICAAVIAAFGVWAGFTGAQAGGVLSTMAIGALVLIAPPATGLIVRQAHDRASLEAERAEQIARLADVRRREAVLRERTLMARELHDTVANYLSAIALQSTGLQARGNPDPETVRESVAAIRQSSVEGLAELRRIIGLLRAADTGEELASYRLDQVPALIDRMRRAGLEVDFADEGPERDLPAETETAAFRVVQEALTNALKYGRDASVAIAYEADSLTVEVTNAVDPKAPAVPGGGSGLIGMTERVRLLGGTVQAGPAPGRWRVRAAIPIGAHTHG